MHFFLFIIDVNLVDVTTQLALIDLWNSDCFQRSIQRKTDIRIL